MSLSRRNFLRASLVGGGSAALLGSFGRLAARTAFASGGSTPYKALVCVFLYGGNDSNNMLLPYTNYATNYAPVRSASTCNFWLPQTGATGVGLLPITPANIGGAPNTAGKQYGLNPTMPKTQSLFASGNVAFLCDVGTLDGPVTSLSNWSSQAPVNLYSHQDQQHEWQTSIGNPDPSAPPRTGWGGRLGDNLPTSTASPPFPAVLSTDQAALFSMGANPPFVTNAGTIPQPSGGDNATYFDQIAALDAGTPLITSANGVLTSALDHGSTLTGAVAGAPVWNVAFDQTTGSIGAQMNLIANAIAGQGTLGLAREVFFCGLGLFDSHAGQAVEQGGVLNGTTSEPGLLAQLDAALWAFSNAMEQIQLGSSVTTFTMSDFARTWKPAALTGTDHAWGSHQIVMGDAVLGGSLYGLDPDTLLSTFLQSGTGGNVYDASATKGGPGEGRWIPQVSVDQYGATLANWLTKDLPNGGQTLLNSVFPNLHNYGASGWPQILSFI